MKNRVIFFFLLLSGSSVCIVAQTPSSTYRSADAFTAMSSDLAKITTSVQTLSATLKSFVDKFEKVSGLSMTEKQQKLILGMELLTRTETRVATLQKSQTELTERMNSTNGRISQIDIDLRPRNINNSTIYEGTTETEELRESKRQKLQNERANLVRLQVQLQSYLVEASEVLRDAQSLAERLRRTFLPQIERELYDQ